MRDEPTVPPRSLAGVPVGGEKVRQVAMMGCRTERLSLAFEIPASALQPAVRRRAPYLRWPEAEVVLEIRELAAARASANPRCEQAPAIRPRTRGGIEFRRRRTVPIRHSDPGPSVDANAIAAQAVRQQDREVRTFGEGGSGVRAECGPGCRGDWRIRARSIRVLLSRAAASFREPAYDGAVETARSRAVQQRSMKSDHVWIKCLGPA